MTDDLPPIPDVIREIHSDEEIDNMETLRGWAVGTAIQIEDGDVVRRIENAWIELFNGEGRAGEFGGVKVFAANEDGEPLDFLEGSPRLIETYAYGTPEAFKGRDRTLGWYVASYTHPEDPDIGDPAP